MNGDEQLVDQIVRRVLHQIERESGGRQPAGSNNRQVQIDEKVITGDILESKANGAAAIVIGNYALLTPSARDVIRQRNLTIERTNAQTNDKTHSNSWKALVCKTTPALEAVLEEANGSLRREMIGTDVEAAQSAISIICRGEANGAIVFSEHPQAVACLANRNRRIRAGIATDSAMAKSVITHFGANILCINPVDQPYFTLRNILRSIPANQHLQAPANWPE